MMPQKIKIELELSPEIAFLVATYLASTSQGDFTLQKSLSEIGHTYIHDVAQSIIDQITEKTDFDHLKLRNRLDALSRRKDDKNFPDELENITN